jgi:hypothetical protein
MTLEKTWKECLRMWKWIANAKLGGNGYSLKNLDVVELKHIWLAANNIEYMFNDCFFCGYAAEHGGYVDPGFCEKCPGQFVKETFNCCAEPRHNDDPVDFYNLLVKLNKKRLSKKGKNDVCNQKR